MADPTPYAAAYSFSGYQATNPADPLPGSSVDTEFFNIAESIATLVAAVKDVRRADGHLQNGSVTLNSLSSGVLTGIEVPTAWATGIDYVVGDTVYEGNAIYICLEDHTSGTFSTDLAAGKWDLVFDIEPVAHSALLAATNTWSGVNTFKIGGSSLPGIGADTVAVFADTESVGSAAAISIIGGTVGRSIISFGDTASETAMSWQMWHQFNEMRLYAGSTLLATFDSNGSLLLTNTGHVIASRVRNLADSDTYIDIGTAGEIEMVVDGTSVATFYQTHFGAARIEADEAEIGSLDATTISAATLLSDSGFTFKVAGSDEYYMNATAFIPATDNANALGGAANRFTEVHAANGTIQTSDARDKTPLRRMKPEEMAAAREIARHVGFYRWKSALDGGEHCGVTVQDVMGILKSYRLDPFSYAFIRREGERYGLIYTDLLMFVARGFEERLSVLEAMAQP